jgi:hypothetical protein
MNKLISYTAHYLPETFSAFMGMALAVVCLFAVSVLSQHMDNFNWQFILEVLPAHQLLQQAMEWVALIPRCGLVGGGLLLSLLACLLIDA